MKQNANIKKKKRAKWKNPLLFILFLLLFFSTAYIIYAIALYKSIETKIRIVGCITLVVLFLLLFTILTKFKKKRKAKVFVILSILALIYCGSISFVAYKVSGIYSKIANISIKKETKFSASIITEKGKNCKDLNCVKGKIGTINDKDDYEGYTIGNLIIEEQEFKNVLRYESYVELLNDLLEGKIDYAIVPTQYDSMFSSNEGLEDIKNQTKIIYTRDEKQKQEKKTNKTQKKLNEPFTVLIMGVDTVDDGFKAGFNGDALLLVTFNPQTTNATILSIPRDTYMPISCMSNRKNKITNAGWRGQDCIIRSIENYFDIDIDYHVKINFNGVVKLVDSVGGVEVDVPYSFCEQNSKRKWGKNTIFVKSGKQKLNGEQALAFARHRKVTPYMVSYCGPEYTQNAAYWNDFTRGQNQQVIIGALLKKFKDIDSFSSIEKILDTISVNIETDISTENILSLYDLGKNILKKSSSQDEAFNMQKLYLQGTSATIYDYSFATNSGSKLNLYNYVAYEESKNMVIKAMKENLGLAKTKPVKTFSFSIKNPFTEKVIGKNIGSTYNLKLMPNFIGLNVSEAEYFANNNNINLKVNYVEGTLGQRVGQILDQSVPSKTDLSMLNSGRTMTVTVVREVVNSPTIPEDDEVDEEDNIEDTEDTEENEENKENENEILDDVLPTDKPVDDKEENSNKPSTETKPEENPTPSESKKDPEAVE